MTTYVARTKNDRLKLVDNRRVLSVRGAAVVLVCGHPAAGVPPLGNPDRWFCDECRGWKGRRR